MTNKEYHSNDYRFFNLLGIFFSAGTLYCILFSEQLADGDLWLVFCLPLFAVFCFAFAVHSKRNPYIRVFDDIIAIRIGGRYSYVPTKIILSESIKWGKLKMKTTDGEITEIPLNCFKNSEEKKSFLSFYRQLMENSTSREIQFR